MTIRPGAVPSNCLPHLISHHYRTYLDCGQWLLFRATHYLANWFHVAVEDNDALQLPACMSLVSIKSSLLTATWINKKL